MDKIEFGRKINYVPAIISCVIGIVVGIGIQIFTKLTLLAVILAITALVVVALLFTRSMYDFFGHWEIDSEGIQNTDYQNFGVRFQAVLFPFTESRVRFKFSDIKSMTVIVGKDMNAPSNILGGSFYAPKKIMFHLPTPYYMEVHLKDGRQVNLDLSADWDDTEVIGYIVDFIGSEAGIDVGMIKQSN